MLTIPGILSEKEKGLGSRLREGGRVTSQEKRRDLTISTLIAECEEYVQTDRFAEDLGSNLSTLFKQQQGKTTVVNKSELDMTDVNIKSDNSDSERKPPRIPPNLRPVKIDKGKGEQRNMDGMDGEMAAVGRFPRESVYDNVEEDGGNNSMAMVMDRDMFRIPSKDRAMIIGRDRDKIKEEEEGEDEGIDNYYSDDSGTPPKVSINVFVVGKSRHCILFFKIVFAVT